MTLEAARNKYHIRERARKRKAWLEHRLLRGFKKKTEEKERERERERDTRECEQDR